MKTTGIYYISADNAYCIVQKLSDGFIRQTKLLGRGITVRIWWNGSWLSWAQMYDENMLTNSALLEPLASALGGIYIRYQYTGDYDNFPAGVLAFAHEGITNAPGNSLYYVVTFSTGPDKYQIAFDYGNGDVFTRASVYGGAWSQWKSR